MARKVRVESSSPEPMEDEVLTDPPTSIDPYTILSLNRTATQDEIKSAYRKNALRHHPDKAQGDQKDEAHQKFQEIALAYAILSDERRRKRYDTTGNTSESLDDDDFDWHDFFREQTQAMVNGDMIEQIKREYQGSEEERVDVLRNYTEHEGDMDAVYENIMCSNVLDDDERFRRYIKEAIKAGEVETFKGYAEDKTKRKKRIERAKAEELEAMELAEELGVRDKLFGKSKSKATGRGGKAANNSGEDALKALIQSRQKDRSANFFDNLEAKYGGGKSNKSKRVVDEPPEEMFRANAKRARSKR